MAVVGVRALNLHLLGERAPWPYWPLRRLKLSKDTCYHCGSSLIIYHSPLHPRTRFHPCRGCSRVVSSSTLPIHT